MRQEEFVTVERKQKYMLLEKYLNDSNCHYTTAENEDILHY